MTVKKGFVIAIATTFGFAIIGALLGALLGNQIPGYYRSVFLIAPDMDADTVSIGIRLGFIDGLQVGPVVGIILALLIAGYRSYSARWSDRVKKRMRTILVSLAVVLLIAAVPVGLFVLYAIAIFPNGRSFPELASLWRDTLQKYETADEAAERIPDLIVLQLDDGQWIFGLTQNSHGIWNIGGGTVVVKDSRGDVRTFIGGHVCGAGYLPGGPTTSENLNAFYEKMKEKGFTELLFPAGQDP